jgi:hypothetical protein
VIPPCGLFSRRNGSQRGLEVCLLESWPAWKGGRKEGRKDQWLSQDGRLLLDPQKIRSSPPSLSQKENPAMLPPSPSSPYSDGKKKKKKKTKKDMVSSRAVPKPKNRRERKRKLKKKRKPVLHISCSGIFCAGTNHLFSPSLSGVNKRIQPGGTPVAFPCETEKGPRKVFFFYFYFF